MGCKLTGWFLPGVYLIAMFFDPRPARLVRFSFAMALATLAVYCVNVGWWFDPLSGLQRFMVSNLTRDKTIPIAIQFLGTTYPFALPWYNTIVWLLFALPVGILVGLIAALTKVYHHRFQPLWCVAIGHFLLLMILRALPMAPGHDGTRQLAIAFAFAGVLAALGWHMVWNNWSRLSAQIAAVLISCEIITSLFYYHPFELSYYSPAVGGLAGAVRLGMEPTYFWDSVGPEARRWLALNSSVDRPYLFRHNPTSWRHLVAWKQLSPPPWQPGDPPPQWIVIQHRYGLFDERDWNLLRTGIPVYEQKLGGVRLLSVYPISAWTDSAPISGKSSS